MQKEIPIFNAVRDPVDAPQPLVAMCKNELASIHLCIHLSGYSNETIYTALGIDKGHWTRMMQGRANFSTNKREALMRFCGNTAPLQYEAMRMGKKIVNDDVEARKAELLAELKKLEEAA